LIRLRNALGGIKTGVRALKSAVWPQTLQLHALNLMTVTQSMGTRYTQQSHWISTTSTLGWQYL